jgi:hypothetical protein
MADHEDVALAADATLLDRFPMRDAEDNIRPEFVEKLPRRFTPRTSNSCARSSPNSMRQTSAT